MPARRMHVFATRDAEHLVQAICEPRDLEPAKRESIKYFSGEFSVTIDESVANSSVFIVGSSTTELAMLCDCARRSSAREVTAAVTYLEYGRASVRKEDARRPIALPLMMAPLLAARPDRILLLDVPHRESFAFMSTDHVHLYGSVYAVQTLRAAYRNRPCVVIPLSPSGWRRAIRFAELIGVESAPGVDYAPPGKDILIVENILDDPSRLLNAVKKLEDGSRKVSAYFSHSLLRGKGVKSLAASGLERVYLTDTIKQPDEVMANRSMFTVITCAPFFSEVFRRVANGDSLARDQLATAMQSSLLSCAA